MYLQSLTMSMNGEEDNDNDEDEQNDHNKNPFGLNSTEIIAALSLELMRASEYIHNPITNKPFDLKFGRNYNKSINIY